MNSESLLTARPTGHPRRRQEALVLLGLLALFAVGVGTLALGTGWDRTMAQFARIGPVQIGVLLGLSLVNYLLRGLRWHLLTRHAGMQTALGQSLRHFLGGFALSVTPARLGELVRMRWLRREIGWPIERTAPMALVDRAADLAAMGVLLALSVAFSTAGIGLALPVAGLAVLASVLVTRPVLMTALVTFAWRSCGRMPRLFARLRTAARGLHLFTRARALAPVLALGVVGWLAEGYAFHILLVWLGADLSLATSVAIFLFATLAGGLTGAPGGLGGAEAAMMALLLLNGIDADAALAATAIIRITTLWFAILTGMAVFPFAERMSRRGAYAQ